jgi:hypothetical protein
MTDSERRLRVRRAAANQGNEAMKRIIFNGASYGMDFKNHPEGGLIEIHHVGEIAAAIVTHPNTVEAAREAYARRDLETYLAIFRLDQPLSEKEAA